MEITELSWRARTGLELRSTDPSPEARERLEKELASIEDHGWAQAFWDAAETAQTERSRGHLLGACRGIYGNFLVCYALRISQVDPLEWELPFERAVSFYERFGLLFPLFSSGSGILDSENTSEEPLVTTPELSQAADIINAQGLQDPSVFWDSIPIGIAELKEQVVQDFLTRNSDESRPKFPRLEFEKAIVPFCTASTMKTMGRMVFFEQLNKLVGALTGWSQAECERIRSIWCKRKISELETVRQSLLQPLTAKDFSSQDSRHIIKYCEELSAYLGSGAYFIGMAMDRYRLFHLKKCFPRF